MSLSSSPTPRTRSGPSSQNLAPRAGGAVDRWWFTLCALACFVVTEYKWRVRPPSEGLSGAIDLQIVVEILGYGLVGLYLLQARTPVPRGRSSPTVVWLLVVYTAFAMLSVAWSPYAAAAAVRGLETIVLLALAWTVSQVGDRAHLHRLCHGFILLTVGSIGFGVLFPMEAPWSDEGRFSWLLVHPTTSGVFMGIAFVLALIYLVAGEADTAGVRWGRLAYLLCLGLLTYGLLANHSRGSVAAAILGVTVSASLVRPLSLRLAALLGLALGAACGLVTFWSTVVAYVARGERADQLATLNNRAGLWEVAFESVRENLLFGTGLYSSRGIFFDTTGLGGGHNAVVNVLVDLGVVGFALWLALGLVMARDLWRMPPFTAGGRILVDRVVILAVAGFLALNGGTAAGIGGLGNVSSLWLYLLVGWTALLLRERPWSPRHPTPAQTPAYLQGVPR